ncbi:alpha/beta hydrolase [Rhabdochlamydiaceae symbiont of Dictyostelium giganteum]|uniref:alpha/beta hydrolase n=1 Tax=Rhabdochlamydiaceae symbiont of Dictyostelium giganteum TaxID=3342349 RepID=UPI00384BE006
MLDVKHAGPQLEMGPCPAVFYFTLRAEDSLELDPLNAPVIPLIKAGIRVFSITLPYHETLSPQKAMEEWALKLNSHHFFIDPFITEVISYLNTLYASNLITTAAVMGLSRGAFIAAHIASQLEWIKVFLGFAPLTHLNSVLLLGDHVPKRWDLPLLAEKLYMKKIRCYIGNLDKRVSTSHCFTWLHTLSQLAASKQIRSPSIELRITPSIGRDGHGTSPLSFEEGALWLIQQLVS